MLIRKHKIMKKIIVCFLFVLPGCGQIIYESPTSPFVTLGSSEGCQTWIYLCGLTQDFNSKKMNELKIIDTIGKECNVKIMAIIPQHRCAEYNYSLCWPHDNKNELLHTYQEIINATNAQPIDGYIGFSNGGFFLIQLAQYISLNKPIIVIGAAGKINNPQGPHNTVDLLIGRQDQWHYEHVVDLYNQSKNTNLTINLIEYDGGHAMPINILKEILLSKCLHIS
jgi:hypothetical protein